MLAHVLGFVGLAAIVAAWQFRARSTILGLNIVAFLLFAGEQYLLQANVGAIMMLAAALNTVAALLAVSRPWALAIVLLPVAFVLLAVEEWYDLLPLIAHCTGAVAFFQRSVMRLRRWAPVGTVLWAFYNVIVGAWGQFFADLFILASMAIGHRRTAPSVGGSIPENWCNVTRTRRKSPPPSTRLDIGKVFE